MSGTDMYNLFRRLEEDNIILSFKGAISRELLNSVYAIMESHMLLSDDQPQRKKKFYHILVESLQNVYHHMQDMHLPGPEREAMFMVAYTRSEGYRIHTGNFIREEEVSDLKQKLESINSMNSEELREYYREKLATTELSDKGGAGLGFIDMARKSGNKLGYFFRPVESGIYFFTFSVTIS